MKVLNTLKICLLLFCARTFGKYRHSGWGCEINYHLYTFMGVDYHFPAPPNFKYDR